LQLETSLKGVMLVKPHFDAGLAEKDAFLRGRGEADDSDFFGVKILERYPKLVLRSWYFATRQSCIDYVVMVNSCAVYCQKIAPLFTITTLSMQDWRVAGISSKEASLLRRRAEDGVWVGIVTARANHGGLTFECKLRATAEPCKARDDDDDVLRPLRAARRAQYVRVAIK
jgi:hypothetical protein